MSKTPQSQSSNIVNLQITGLSNLGQGFAAFENDPKKRKIFVSKTAVGDEIEARIVKEHSKFVAAHLTKITFPSLNRQTPPCPYFSDCGGCELQHLKPSFYQNFKRQILLDIFGREKMDFEGEVDWSFIPSGFRRRTVFQIDHENRLGFFREGSNDLVKIDECLILENSLSHLIPKLQSLVLEIAHLAKSKVKKDQIISQISATNFDNGIALIFHLNSEPILEINDLLTNFAKENNIINLSIKINDDVSLVFQSVIPQLFFDEIKIDLSANIFLQATKVGQDIIVSEINHLISLLRGEHGNPENLNIVDLYCGIGTYSFGVLAQSPESKIKAFEGERHMINSLNKNVTKNNLNQNLQGFVRDLVKNPLQPKDFIGDHLVIINPPRNGAESQIKQLAKSGVKTIIYISCNPPTFASDAKILLQSGYKIGKIKAIDQFVYSHHLELVAIFQLSTSKS